MSEFAPILIYLGFSLLVSLILVGLPFLFSSNSSTYPEKLSAETLLGMRVLLLVIVILLAYSLFDLIGADFSILNRIGVRALLMSFLKIICPFAYSFPFILPFLSLSVESFMHILPNEGDANAPQPPVENAVPVLQGMPVVLGSPEAIHVVPNIVSILEPRINELTERAGLVIGPEEQHLAYLRQTAFSIIHDVEPPLVILVESYYPN
jgi:hypothetical protein